MAEQTGMAALAQWVKALRDGMRFSQADLEARGGPGEATVRRIERGEVGEIRSKTKSQLELALARPDGWVDRVLAGTATADELNPSNRWVRAGGARGAGAALDPAVGISHPGVAHANLGGLKLTAGGQVRPSGNVEFQVLRRTADDQDVEEAGGATLVESARMTELSSTAASASSASGELGIGHGWQKVGQLDEATAAALARALGLLSQIEPHPLVEAARGALGELVAAIFARSGETVATTTGSSMVTATNVDRETGDIATRLANEPPATPANPR